MRPPLQSGPARQSMADGAPDSEPVKTPLCLLVVKGGRFVLKTKVPVKMD